MIPEKLDNQPILPFQKYCDYPLNKQWDLPIFKINIKLILKEFKKVYFLLEIKFDTIQYLNKLKKSNSYFHTFIDKKSLAAGIIFLKPGEKDTQDPHESDEIYYILDGNGFLNINDKSYRIKKEQIYFVAKNVPHYFYGNTENLSVLYFFGGSDS